MDKTIKIFNADNYSVLLPGLKLVQIHKIEAAKQEIVSPVLQLENLNISNGLSCSSCKINFEDNIQQRQHYKSDWHRYNLKQNLKLLEPLSEDKFEQLADDVSSISGSDSDSEDNSEKDNSINALYQGKVYFKNDSGEIFSIYRALLHEKKDAPANDDCLLRITRLCARKTCWTLLMLGGGHFAGAVFDGPNILVHKTFHLYTVRAKQGGSQYNHAAGAKSAGANLRRYNEQALIQLVGDLLRNWEVQIEKSNLLFYRAAGPYNRTVLFGGKNPILKKNDSRLRTIPFPTKRPTLKEVKRVHDVLTNVEIYSSIESIQSQFITQKTNEEVGSPRQSRHESPTKNKNINRAKSRETKEVGRPLPGLQEELSSEFESDAEIEISTENLDLSFNDLKEFEDTVPQNVKKNKESIKKKKLKKKDRIKKWEDSLKRNLYNACIKGNLELLKTSLESIKKDETECVENQMTATKALNMVIDVHGNTALHIAALNNHNDMIIWLMENDSSPCNKNDKQNTPYTVNSDKSVRNVFRSFATENPEKYNYAKSQIPIIATMTEEIAEKKKAQRKAKREREKDRRKDNEIKKKEEDDKNRFLKLNDREKRALAAERRILAQTSVILVRCFMCGEDISGKVPFEYSGNRFCSIVCLKAHRLQCPVVLS